MNKSILLMALLAAMPVLSTHAGNPVGFAVGGYPCALGGVQVTQGTNDACAGPGAVTDGTNWLYGIGQTWVQGPNHGYLETWAAYSPFSGKYMARSYICKADEPSDVCSIQRSVTSIDTHYVELDNSKQIDYQDVNFGGPTRIQSPFPYKTKICLTLVDINGNEWSTTGPVGCKDAPPLPDHPMRCSLSASNLNIAMTVERNKLASVAKTGAGIQKQLTMTCEGKASASYSLSLTTNTPLVISNGTAIGTSTKGLGVAMFYNNTMMSPGSNFSTEFKPGSTQINLEFVPVRDPNVTVNEVSTGDFSADAVLVMTEQ